MHLVQNQMQYLFSVFKTGAVDGRAVSTMGGFQNIGNASTNGLAGCPGPLGSN